jgi:hypothetical protein
MAIVGVLTPHRGQFERESCAGIAIMDLSRTIDTNRSPLFYEGTNKLATRNAPMVPLYAARDRGSWPRRFRPGGVRCVRPRARGVGVCEVGLGHELTPYTAVLRHLVPYVQI